MSSARGRKRKECTGKIGYETQHDAIMALRRVSISDLHSYKCRFCGKWHLGHVPWKVRKIIETRKGAI